MHPEERGRPTPPPNTHARPRGTAKARSRPGHGCSSSAASSPRRIAGDSVCWGYRDAKSNRNRTIPASWWMTAATASTSIAARAAAFANATTNLAGILGTGVPHNQRIRRLGLTTLPPATRGPRAHVFVLAAAPGGPGGRQVRDYGDDVPRPSTSSPQPGLPLVSHRWPRAFLMEG